jgi:hypothetical protein
MNADLWIREPKRRLTFTIGAQHAAMYRVEVGTRNGVAENGEPMNDCSHWLWHKPKDGPWHCLGRVIFHKWTMRDERYSGIESITYTVELNS